jgi:hypothetical protein
VFGKNLSPGMLLEIYLAGNQTIKEIVREAEDCKVLRLFAVS